MSIAYSSRRLGLRLIPVGVCLIWIGGGILQLLIVAGGALLTFIYVQQVYALLGPALRQGIPNEQTTIMAFSAFVHLVIVVPVLLAGLGGGLAKLVAQGLAEWVPLMPANIPYDYDNIAEVKNGFSKRSLNLYTQQAPTRSPNGWAIPPCSCRHLPISWSTGWEECPEKDGRPGRRRHPAGAGARLYRPGRARPGITPGGYPPDPGVHTLLILRQPCWCCTSSWGWWRAFPLMILVPRSQPNTVAHEGTEGVSRLWPSRTGAGAPAELEIPLRWESFVPHPRRSCHRASLRSSRRCGHVFSRGDG